MAILATYLDKLLGKAVAYAGTLFPARPTINFTGGVVVTDDDANNATTVNVLTVSGAVYSLDSGSGAVTAGDFACLLASGSNHLALTRATPSALAAAGTSVGVFLESHAPGDTGIVIGLVGTLPNTLSLGAGAAGTVAIVNARAARVKKPSGAEFIAGTCDTNGKITLQQRTSRATSPRHVYNILAYGGMGDGEQGFGISAGGAGTDNLPALNAILAAIAVNPVSDFSSAIIYFPPANPGATDGAVYSFNNSDYVTIQQTVTMLGDSGFESTKNTHLVFNQGVGSLNFAWVPSTGGASGSTIRNLHIAQPYGFAPRTWNLIKGTETGAGHPIVTVTTYMYPNTGMKGVIFRGQSSTPTAMGSTQPALPRDWQPERFFRTGTKILVSDAQAGQTIPWEFVCLNSGTSFAIPPVWPTTVSGTVAEIGGLQWQLVTKTPSYADNATSWIPMFPAHVVKTSARLIVEDVSITQGHGDGYNITAGQGTGNADSFYVHRLSCSSNGGNGITIRGSTASAGYTLGVEVTSNGGYGILEWSELGNLHAMPHSEFNVRGAYLSIGSTNASSWIQPYVEGGQPPPRFLTPCVIVGGLLGNAKTNDSFAPHLYSNAATPTRILSSRNGFTWGLDDTSFYSGANLPREVGDNIFSVNNDGWAYQVFTSGTAGNTEPSPYHHASFGDTTNDGTIVYKALGPSYAQMYFGQPDDPTVIFSYTNSILSIGAPLQLRFGDNSFNSTYQGFFVWTVGSATSFGYATVGSNLSVSVASLEAGTNSTGSGQGLWSFLGPLQLGSGAQQRAWDFVASKPTSTLRKIGSIWWNTAGTLGGPAGWYLTTRSGGGDTISNFGKIWTDTEELFPSPSLKAAGGVGSDATALADDAYVRWAHTVATATTATLDSFTPTDGSCLDVVWDFMCKQTTGTGSPKGAKFRATISLRRSGSSLIILDAKAISLGTGNEIAPTVDVDVSAAPVVNLTMNTGDASKTFVSSGIREIIGLPTV